MPMNWMTTPVFVAVVANAGGLSVVGMNTAQTTVTTDSVDTTTERTRHLPLVWEPTQRLRYSEFALWCGNQETSDRTARRCVEAIVYGHLHLPVSSRIGGVSHPEISPRYPYERYCPGVLERWGMRVISSERGV